MNYACAMQNAQKPAEQPKLANPPASEPDVRMHRTLGDEEFKSKLEMTKAFCDTAKGYVQISSAGLAVPLLLNEAVLGKARTESGLGQVPCTLTISWISFLVSIACGLIYQWLSMRRLWDQYHGGHRTIHNMHEAGYRITKAIPQTGGINLSYIWSGMVFGLILGAAFFVAYAWGLIAHGR
jgi:hypothetical protein